MAEGRCEVRGDSISENTNWRSSSDVIRFNNTFFSALVRNLGYEEIYSNVAQQISKNTPIIAAMSESECMTVIRNLTGCRKHLKI